MKTTRELMRVCPLAVQLTAKTRLGYDACTRARMIYFYRREKTWVVML
jgi:hypothetical protein